MQGEPGRPTTVAGTTASAFEIISDRVSSRFVSLFQLNLQDRAVRHRAQACLRTTRITHGPLSLFAQSISALDLGIQRKAEVAAAPVVWSRLP